MKAINTAIYILRIVDGQELIYIQLDVEEKSRHCKSINSCNMGIAYLF